MRNVILWAVLILFILLSDRVRADVISYDYVVDVRYCPFNSGGFFACSDSNGLSAFFNEDATAEGTFTFDDEEVALGPGEGIVISSGRAHGAYVPVTAPETRTYNVFTPVRDQPPDA